MLAFACASAPRGPLPSAPPAEPIQALFRAELLANGSDRVSLRWTLRRWSAERFELAATDLFGRALWSLAVAGDDGLWIDAREKARCRFSVGAAARFGSVTLSLPSRALPDVLLGLLPVELPAAAEAGDGVRHLQFDDGEGRSWRVVLDGARVVSWRVGSAAGDRLEWDRRGDRLRLRSDVPDLVIEWRQTARERLAIPEPAWRIADAAECGDAALP